MKKLFIITILILCFITSSFTVAFAAKKTKNLPIEVETKDGILLEGKLVLPKGVTTKNKAPMVLMLHSIGSNKSVYENLAKEMKEAGIASLLMDSRGHGASIYRISGKKTYWRNYKRAAYQKYPSDIIEVLNHIRQNYFQIDTSKIAIVAADVNANAAIIAAATPQPNDIKTLVLLSPAIDYFGLEPAISLVKYGKKPIMFMASKKDNCHLNQAKELAKYAQGKVQLDILQFGGIGDSMIRLNPETESFILKWVKENI